MFPGRDYHHQLSLILDVLGTPSLEEFYAINSRRSRDYLRAMPFRKRKPFSILYPVRLHSSCVATSPADSRMTQNASPAALNFLERSLTFDPKKRMTVEEALAHPYLEAYHDPTDEPSCAPIPPEFFDFDLQKEEISREELKQLLYDEISTFKPLC